MTPIRVYTPHGGSLNYNPGTLAHAIFMPAERVLGQRTDLFCFESDFARTRYETYVGQPKGPSQWCTTASTAMNLNP